jgi:SAM-dependent methyltransferase
MDEILSSLPARARVLDLGCAGGSFPRAATHATTIRCDRDTPADARNEIFVQADAAHLPFRDGAFTAAVLNHSLEHFDHLARCLEELGRVIDPQGSLFVAVPDASTFTDKLYRWLARGGGHVNAFVSPDQVARAVESATGLRHIATKTLWSSLSFLNRRNSPLPRPRRLLLLGGGHEWSLFLYVWASRAIDRLFNLRTGIYGWAFYFGRIAGPIDTTTSPNVCIRCGSGAPVALLEPRRVFGLLRVYTCPRCGAGNPFIGRA